MLLNAQGRRLDTRGTGGVAQVYMGYRQVNCEVNWGPNTRAISYAGVYSISQQEDTHLGLICASHASSTGREYVPCWGSRWNFTQGKREELPHNQGLNVHVCKAGASYASREAQCAGKVHQEGLNLVVP